MRVASVVWASAVVACVLGVPAAAPRAQQQGAEPPVQTFASGVDAVSVDVSVLDRNRRPVRGLTAADFTILEDGKPRPVAAFTAIDLPRRDVLTTSAPWVVEVAPDVTTNEVPAEGRLVVILMDRTTRPPLQPMARGIANALIDGLGPEDLAAVVFTGSGAPQNFTADRSLLRASASAPFVSLMGDDWGSPGECYCGLCSLEAMTRAADAIRDVPLRRKSLLFIGSYVGIVSWPSPDRVDCRDQIRAARDKLTRAVEAAHLTVSTIDPSGLETGVLSAGDNVQARNALAAASGKHGLLLERLDSLRVLADIGGGRAILDTNAPADNVPALLDETASYYVLGFQSALSGRDGRFHKIDVSVNRQDVTVDARRGYVATKTPSKATGANVAAATADDALLGLLPEKGLHLSISATPFAAPGQRESPVLLAMGIDAPRDREARGPAGATEDIEIVAAAFDTNGKSAATVRQTVTAEFPGVPNYGAMARLDLRPGRYEIRAAVRHRRSTLTGSVYTFVEVPDFSKAPLSLSGLLLLGPTPTIVTPRKVFDDVVTAMPTTERAFTASDEVSALVRVYQGGNDPLGAVSVRCRIIDADGKLAIDEPATLPSAAFNARAGQIRWVVPLAKLRIGAYLLTIDVTRGGVSATRTARFSVE